jgi:acid stress-induced BolA-like protein IbaG/YrbA
MAKRKNTKRQKIIYKTLHRKRAIFNVFKVYYYCTFNITFMVMLYASKMLYAFQVNDGIPVIRKEEMIMGHCSPIITTFNGPFQCSLTDNIMAKRKNTKRQKIIYKTLHRKLKI